MWLKWRNNSNKRQSYPFTGQLLNPRNWARCLKRDYLHPTATPFSPHFEKMWTEVRSLHYLSNSTHPGRTDSSYFQTLWSQDHFITLQITQDLKDRSKPATAGPPKRNATSTPFTVNEVACLPSLLVWGVGASGWLTLLWMPPGVSKAQPTQHPDIRVETSHNWLCLNHQD